MVSENGNNRFNDSTYSFALWQINSTEKLKASAKATTSHIDWALTRETIIMIRQNKLTITVNAFFSDKYFFILLGLLDSSKDYKFIWLMAFYDPGFGQLAETIG